MTGLTYFPCVAAHKNPVGGVCVDEPFSIRAELTDPSGNAALYLVLKKEGAGEEPVYYPMESTGRTGELSAYTRTMAVTSPGLYFYYFHAAAGAETRQFYARRDLTAGTEGGREWQLTVYENRYEAPVWFGRGVVYQIMPDRFCVGSERFKTKPGMNYRTDWGGVPTFLPNEKGIYENKDMFGGNLYGIAEKAAYLRSLNVGTLYLNPIFDARSSHKYDTGDYERVDGDFGGDAALRTLIDAAAACGMRVVLDGVFSHTGDDSVYFNKYGRYDGVGAYQSKDSPYYSWYSFKRFPDEYDCWWNIKIHPNVNETEPSYLDFICGDGGVLRRYLKMGIGGWRLDVADELPEEFLDALTRCAKDEKADALILGEVWEDASNKCAYGKRRRYLLGGQLDSVTNYPFRTAILDFVLTGDARLFADRVHTIIDHYPKKTLDILMNVLSSHDVERTLTLLSGDARPDSREGRATAVPSDREKAVNRLKMAAVIQYTLPGVPLLYYGDEAGMYGYEDPFNRGCFPWAHIDKGLLKFYRRLGALREEEGLRTGGFLLVMQEAGRVGYRRGDMLVLVNNTDSEYEIPGKPMRELLSGKICGRLPAFTAAVFKEK